MAASSFARTMVVGVIAMAAWLVPAAVAGAATVSASGSTLSYVAEPGENNDVTASLNIVGNDSFTITFTDPGAAITNTASFCSQTGGIVSCDASASPEPLIRVDVSTGDGSDTLRSQQTVSGAPTLGSRPATWQYLGRFELHGGADVDTFAGGAGSDVLDGGAGSEVLEGGAGRDFADYRARSTPVIASQNGLADDGETAQIEGDSIPDTTEGIWGGSANDVLRGPAATLHNGFYEGGLGDDTIDGGPGTDRTSYWNAATSGGVTVDLALVGVPQNTLGAGSDTLIGVEGVEGSRLDDVLRGGPDAEYIAGAQGSDSLQGGLGADTLYGDFGLFEYVGVPEFRNPGRDTVSYEDRTAPGSDGLGVQVTPTLTAGNDGLDCTGATNTSAPAACERDVVGTDMDNMRGTAFADSLSAGQITNVMEGLGGNDALVAFDNVGDRLIGGSGDDSFSTSAGAGIYEGGPGDDSFQGIPSSAQIVDYGASPAGVRASIGDGTGDDGVQSGPFAERDTIGPEVDRVLGSSHGDELRGNPARNLLDGRDGDDVLSGGGERDQLLGRAGADMLSGGAGGDTLEGGDGSDTVSYADAPEGVTVSLDGFANDGAPAEGDNAFTDVENLDGSPFDDGLTGNAAANRFAGGGGGDALRGEDGDDTLDGGDGGDNLDGAEGDDRLALARGADTASGGPGRDLASYADSPGAVTASLDGARNDGVAGEGDLIETDVEDLEGSDLGDRLLGGAGVNRVFGRAGNDGIDVRDASADAVACGEGADTVSADPADDVQPDCEPAAALSQAPGDPVDEPRKRRIEDLPPPVLGKRFNVEPVAGHVLVALPAGASSARARASQIKGLRFVPLQEARQIPVGSFLDTRRGTVRMGTARGAGSSQFGNFAGGIFQVLQSGERRDGGLTQLALKGSSFAPCRGSASGRRAQTARRRVSRRTIRRLRGSARGRFRTRGRYSAATVRGTTWSIADRCDGTLTRVGRGKVVVRDFRRKRDVLVRAGKSYLARAPR